MVRSVSQLIALVICCISTSASAVSARNAEQQRIAFDVAIGREMIHAVLKACELHYRAGGFDPRFFVFFSDTDRFEVYEGARITLGDEFYSAEARKLVTETLPHTSPTRERCERLVLDDKPQNRIVPGVTQENLQQMRDVYISTNPHPHVARDRSLFGDCIKANFNARQLNFDSAFQSCGCTLTAMRAVPESELDQWFVRARSGANVPMENQSWFPALLPKLQACTAR